VEAQGRRQVWLNPIVKYAYPVIGRLSVNDIVAEHVATIVRAAAADGNLETGKRTAQRVRKVLNGAIARGERDPLRGNPADADLIGEIVPLKRKTIPFRRIKLDDAPGVFHALQEAGKAASGLRATELDAWLFHIACASRPSETLYARWSEIDLDKRLWTVPAARMKSDREHIVPLSQCALEVLERRDRVRVRTGDAEVDSAALVFAGATGRALNYTLFALGPKRAGIDGGAPHSWRSIFSDWRGEKTNFARELAEFALAHLVPGVAGDYQRETAPQRRYELMEAYGKWLTSDSNVVRFQKRA
jgi:integrase